MRIKKMRDDWKWSLMAEDKSQNTIDIYLSAVDRFLDYLRDKKTSTDLNSITRSQVEGFLIHLREQGRRPTTVANRYRALQTFFKYCVQEEEIERSPMENIKPPKVPDQPVPIVPDDVLGKLIKVCDGKDFYDRRDKAIILLFANAGLRREELANLRVDDIEFERKIGLAHVVGKGKKARSVPFDPDTAVALQRYLRLRDAHSHAEATDHLWLGQHGHLSANGIRQMLIRRAREIGLDGLHPHQLRHTFAHKWLMDGGEEGDLMRLAGWSSRQMLQRYGASAADERAREAYARMYAKRRASRS